MGDRARVSTPDIADRHRKLLALSMLSFAFMYGASAAIHLLDPESSRFLDPLRLGLAALALAPILWVTYWRLRKLPRGDRELYSGADGFVWSIILRAQGVSWAVALLLLLALETFADRQSFESLPTEFYLQSVIAVMLGVLSLCFLMLSASAEHDHERSRA